MARAVVALVWLPDDRRLVSIDWSGAVRLWDTESEVAVMSADHPPPLNTDQGAIAISPDGQRLLTGYLCGPTVLWSLDPRKITQ
jgi:WD40 repeat protein